MVGCCLFIIVMTILPDIVSIGGVVDTDVERDGFDDIRRTGLVSISLAAGCQRDWLVR